MSDPENLVSFFKENKSLLKEYIETRLAIFRLQAIKISSKSAGYLVWIIVSLFLLFLIAIFSGMTLGYWLSSLTGSNIEGFGLTALFMLVVFVFFAVFRRKLFVNPLVKTIIQSSMEEMDEEENAD
ncbi:MAG TPA: hypothetical protein VKR53_08080 [Puia sp.]|nr:hypothetical protein [Puia sp.]